MTDYRLPKSLRARTLVTIAFSFWGLVALAIAYILFLEPIWHLFHK